MVKKILMTAVKIIAWSMVGIAALYLAGGFVLFPLVAPKIVTWQGSKLLARPVSLGGASFNPLTLGLQLSDFKIQDTDQSDMLGFKKLRIAVDAGKLLHKKYHITAIDVDGLNINAVLLPGNRLNLSDLMPATTPAAAPPPEKPAAEPLPDVAIDAIALSGGRVSFTDHCVGNGFTLTATDIALTVTGISTKPDSQVILNCTALIDGKGKVSTKASVKPFGKLLQTEVAFILNDYAVAALTPYTGRYTGRAVGQDGKLDISIAYRIADNKLTAEHTLLAQRFAFAEKVNSKDALRLPFDLAVALLKDTRGNIDISLPVHGDLNDPKFKYWHILGQVAGNFFMKIVTSPFKALAVLVPSGGGETQELNTVTFAPGDTALSPTQKQHLTRLAAAMMERPGISVRINGGYDPETDWNALKAKTMDEELVAARTASPVTENSFYARKYTAEFGDDNYAALKARFTAGTAVDEPALTAEMKRLLIARMPADKGALTELARARMGAVQEALSAGGFDAARAKSGSVRAVLAILREVPTELVLTVEDDEHEQTSTGTMHAKP